jgi:hypothetical protein
MLWVQGNLTSGVKWLGREADHSPSTSAEAKNAWSYNSTPQYAFMAWNLVMQRDKFTSSLPSLLSVRSEADSKKTPYMAIVSVFM